MYRCRSGKHWWLNESDAGKCCNGFKRVLVFGGGSHRQVIEGAVIGRAWMPDPKGGENPDHEPGREA